MRTVEDIRREFDDDFANPKINNNTLEVKYLKSILEDHITDKEITDEDKEKYITLRDDLIEEIKDRDDAYYDFIDRMNKATEDIKKGFRIYPETSRGSIGVKFPTTYDDEQVELVCSKRYNKLMQDKEMLTEKEILRILENREIWSQADEDRIEQLIEEYRDLSTSMSQERAKKEEANQKKLSELKKELDLVEKEYTELNQTRLSHVQNSIENRVEDLRIRLRLMACIYHVEGEGEGAKLGKKYWNTETGYNNEVRAFTYEILALANQYWRGLDSSLLELAPSE